ncbi:MAG: FAD-dependent oxidoreductase, partial [Planctomycetales bacterium]|nr:FAD-dependent oxidoreductase [Planctomycetales bacterium]
MKIVVVGGVAGGASAAARARRLSDDAEIIVLERGHHPSFANCGLPYYVGGEIQSRDKLLVAPVEMLRKRHRLDVRTRSEVIRIDLPNSQVVVQDLETGDRYNETYDKLIIATGASPFRPPIEGIDGPRVLTLRDLNDADLMHQHATSGAKRCFVVGAGFIGVEVAENLVRRGIRTTMIDISDQILTPWDREMVVPLEDHLRQQGVELRLNESVQRFVDTSSNIDVHLAGGEVITADFAVVSIGVRPESRLAADAGIACNPRGGIIVDDHMRSSVDNVYAVGDVTQVSDFITGQPTQVPLAGPANRQGRIAADHIFGRDSRYRGTQGSSVVGVFGMTAAMTGQSEKTLRRAGTACEKIYIHPSDHAGYYPGAQGMTLKLVFEPGNGKILGAQCVGGNGVAKRIDVIAMAIQAGMTVDDLEESELCYAPQYGHAKDPINMAGFVAAGVLRGDHPIVHAESLVTPSDRAVYLLDVRTESEFAAGHLPGATN